MLAFTLHQIHELTDKLFQQARTFYRTKRELWHGLQFLFNMMIFDSWLQMIGYAVKVRDPEFEGLRPT